MKNGIIYRGGKIYTIHEGKLRYWNPYRSKLAAALKKGMKVFPFSRFSRVLYLGAAAGTTVSHISDICSEGTIFAVEISERVFRDLLCLAEKRKNIIPILADARHPEQYGYMLPLVDIIYQDVAQRDQTEILLKNTDYLKPGGYVIYALKTRSIDVSEDPKKIIEVEIKKMAGYFRILEKISLDPYAKDHFMIVGLKQT